MLNKFLFLVLFISLFLASDQKEEIKNVLNDYNDAFGKADYSKIVSFFDTPASFNLEEKTITACTKLKLRLIYWKIRGGLPDYYSYSNWNEIKIQLVDSNIAIVNANFSRYKEDGTWYDSGSAQYNLRLIGGDWKIFSLTPYKTIKDL